MNDKKKIVILGGSGLLGKPLTECLKNSQHEVVTFSKNSLDSDYNVDACDSIQLYSALSEINPDVIVNLIAITSVDYCEDNIPAAYQVHVKVNEVLANYCVQAKAKVLHISTDHFYEGNDSSEKDVYPKNVYGLTKLMGESALRDCDSVILRTNFFGKSQTEGRLSLTDVMYSHARKGNKLNLFNDVYFSPLSIGTLCSCIAHVIQCWIPGVYNLGSKNGMSKENFVLQFLKASGYKDVSFDSVSINDSNLDVARPKDMRMNVELFERVYCYQLPSLANEIDAVVGDYSEK